MGGKNTNKKKVEDFSVNKATASGRGLPSHFLPYDDPYEQDENEGNDGGHDALLVHLAMQMGKSNLENLTCVHRPSTATRSRKCTHRRIIFSNIPDPRSIELQFGAKARNCQ